MTPNSYLWEDRTLSTHLPVTKMTAAIEPLLGTHCNVYLALERERPTEMSSLYRLTVLPGKGINQVMVAYSERDAKNRAERILDDFGFRPN